MYIVSCESVLIGEKKGLKGQLQLADANSTFVAFVTIQKVSSFTSSRISVVLSC